MRPNGSGEGAGSRGASPEGPPPALLRALAWAAADGGELYGLLERAEIVALRDVLAGRARPRPEQFTALVVLAQILFRIDPPPWGETRAASRVSLGDALGPWLARVPRPSPPWSPEPRVDAQAFTRLGHDETADGIDAQHAENEAGWRVHRQRAKRFILEAADALPRRGTALVVGAGRAYDLPLAELAARFERVVAVDVDGAALEEAIAAEVPDPALRARVERQTVDLTGISGPFVARVDRLVRGAATRPAAEQGCARLLAGYRADALPRLWVGTGRVDLAVSCLVLSQLAVPMEQYVLRALTSRFGPAAGAEGDGPLGAARLRFALAVQHEHLEALAAVADTAALVSDVWEQHVTVTDAGGVEPLTDELRLLGVYRLEERIPSRVAIEAADEWLWERRLAPRPGELGARLRVQGLRLRFPTSQEAP